MNRTVLFALPLATMAVLLGMEIFMAGDDTTIAGISSSAAAQARSAAHPGQPLENGGIAPPALAEAATTALARPLFSPDRRPAKPPAAAKVDAPPAETVPRLSGIIVGPSGRKAIFVDAAGHPRIASEGSTIGGFTVGKIEPDQITLIAASGRHVLHPSFAASGAQAPGSSAMHPPLSPTRPPSDQ